MKYIVLLLSAGVFLFMNTFGMGIILAPVEYLVTIIHEGGHALAAILTGGSVHLLEISPNGGGFTQTSGGSMPIVTMAGYLGSILFANIFIFFGFTNYKVSRIISFILFLIITFMAFAYFNSFGSTIIQLAYAGFFLLVSWKLTKISNYVLISLGTMALVDALMNFNVHPQSDLQMYSESVGGSPSIWMYVWLGLAILITAVNALLIYKKGGFLKSENNF